MLALLGTEGNGKVLQRVRACRSGRRRAAFKVNPVMKIEVQDLAMCREMRGSTACADLAKAERDAERLVKRLDGLVAAGALPAGVVELARHLEDALSGACIQVGA